MASSNHQFDASTPLANNAANGAPFRPAIAAVTVSGGIPLALTGSRAVGWAILFGDPVCGRIVGRWR